MKQIEGMPSDMPIEEWLWITGQNSKKKPQDIDFDSQVSKSQEEWVKIKQ